VTPNIPKDLVFTIEGRPIPAGWVVPPPSKPAEGGVPAVTQPPAPVFGPEYAGQFKLKYPRAMDRLRMAGASTRAWELRGVDNPGRVPPLELQIQDAFAFFEVLGLEKPDWFSPEAPDSGLLFAAVLTAHRIAEEEIIAAKKNFDGTGGSS